MGSHDIAGLAAAPPTTALAGAGPVDGLNDEQRAAARFGIDAADSERDRPLLVIAGAGTGKTATLAQRVAALIAAGADPARILLLTFSRRAAAEMCRRVARILGRTGRTESQPWRDGAGMPALEWAGTFHAVGARLLREYAERIGLAPGFSIHDREDSADLMNLMRHELGLSSRDKRFPLKGTCLAIYSAAVNTRSPLPALLRESFPWCATWEADLRRLFRAYVEAKQAQQVLDYDDLLLGWAQMAAEPALAAELGARYTHILVDEYQDTNPLQAAILLGMKPDGRGLTVVGDDAQAIYAFRGATVRNILDFPRQFAPPARVAKLERNYRSTQPILAAANAVIALAVERHAKELWTARLAGGRPRLVTVKDEADQAGFVAGQVLAQREEGIPLSAQAVLFRSGHHAARLEIELTRRNIPFVKFGGLKFLEAAHVKDALAVLRWSRNRRDRVAGFRALQLLDGVGPRSASRLLDTAAADGHGGALAAASLPPRLAEAATAAWREFAATLDAAAATPWPASFEHLCAWVGARLERRYDDPAPRAADLAQLARIAAGYPNDERFLTELTLDPPEATSDEAGVPLRDEDYLILSTIHSAKGQEWRAVTLLNAVDGCIPSDLATGTTAEIEEERRLLYVAMTRARDHLDIVVPQRFHVTQQAVGGDRHVYAGRTRFIPDSVLGCFEAATWPQAAPLAAADSATMARAIDLGARLRAMW